MGLHVCEWTMWRTDRSSRVGSGASVGRDQREIPLFMSDPVTTSGEAEVPGLSQSISGRIPLLCVRTHRTGPQHLTAHSSGGLQLS